MTTSNMQIAEQLNELLSTAIAGIITKTQIKASFLMVVKTIEMLTLLK